MCPAQAILNYLYSILEAEARLACLTVGLDPGLGVLHADLNARDSLALDVMEPVRPLVDRYVLALLTERPFRAADLHETRQGAVRVLAPLSHELASTALTWRAHVGPVAERVAALLLAGEGAAVPTPISGRNRSLGRGRPAGPRPPALPRRASACLYCGGAPVAGRRTCDACAPEAATDANRRLVEAGLAELADRRAQGEQPGHTPEANAARGRQVSVQRRAANRWDGPPLDPEAFRRGILPGLQSHSVREIARAAGIGTTYAGLVRRGERVPHPRLWAPLRALGDDELPLG